MQKDNHETGNSKHARKLNSYIRRQYKGKRMRALGYALVAVIIVAVLVKYIVEKGV